MPKVEPSVISKRRVPVSRQRREGHQTNYESILRMLKKWAADESGYEERTWPLFKEQLELNRMSYRKRFSD